MGTDDGTHTIRNQPVLKNHMYIFKTHVSISWSDASDEPDKIFYRCLQNCHKSLFKNQIPFSVPIPQWLLTLRTFINTTPLWLRFAIGYRFNYKNNVLRIMVWVWVHGQGEESIDDSGEKKITLTRQKLVRNGSLPHQRVSFGTWAASATIFRLNAVRAVGEILKVVLRRTLAPS